MFTEGLDRSAHHWVREGIAETEKTNVHEFLDVNGRPVLIVDASKHLSATLRDTIHQEYRDVVERRVFTVTSVRADEETIERLIETEYSEHIFRMAIQEQGGGQIMDTLAKIQERHDAVKDHERKLLDLQQDFCTEVVKMFEQLQTTIGQKHHGIVCKNNW